MSSFKTLMAAKNLLGGKYSHHTDVSDAVTLPRMELERAEVERTEVPAKRMRLLKKGEEEVDVGIVNAIEVTPRRGGKGGGGEEEIHTTPRRPNVKTNRIVSSPLAKERGNTYAGRLVNAALHKTKHNVVTKHTKSKDQLQPKDGVIKTSAGFLRTYQDMVENDGTTDGEVAEEKEEVEIKKKSAREYLNEPAKVKQLKIERSKMNSFWAKYKTLKKKVSQHQVEHGAEADFVLLIKNNVQDPSVRNAAKTAGKYMVFAGGPAKQMLIEEGIKYKRNTMYLMENHIDIKEEIVEEEEESEGGDVEKEEQVAPSRPLLNTPMDMLDIDSEEEEVEAAEERLNLFNMKLLARKMNTPGS